ncbi:MAG: hypothetical protein E6H58_17480, partial [Betaproteobacteria bacterium]
MHVEVGEHVDLEVELRHQVDDRVVAEAALDARDADVGPGAQLGARLHGGRGDCEVALERHADDADVVAHADPVERRRDVRRDLLEVRVEAAGADDEGRLVAERGAERELAEDRDERDARMDQLRVERDAQRVEHHRADEVEPQVEQCNVGRDERRQRDDALAEQRELVGLDEQAESHGDEARRSPAELEHRADDEAAGLDREQRAQRVDDLRRVRYRVVRKQHRVELSGAERLRQRRRARGVLHADQPADAGQ